MADNLDLKCAELSSKIISETKDKKLAENVITKTLGVLESNGVYACLLYLFSRKRNKEGEITGKIAEKILEALAGVDGIPAFDINEFKADINDSGKKTLQYIRKNLCNNIDSLLLVKKIWEQILIYARYEAKAELF